MQAAACQNSTVKPCKETELGPFFAICSSHTLICAITSCVFATAHRCLTGRLRAVSSKPPYVDFFACLDDELDDEVAGLAMVSAPCFFTAASAASMSANHFLYSAV